MQAMDSAIKTIPIHAAEAQAACGGCLHDIGQPLCRAMLGHDCLAPVLQGPPDAVRRVMAVLGASLGFDAGAADAGAGRLVSLRVHPGDEVDLVLSGEGHCGATLADAAFLALRGLLPDTDIYVRSAA